MQEDSNAALAVVAEIPSGGTDEASMPTVPDGALQEVSAVVDEAVESSTTAETEIPAPNRGLSGLSFSHVAVNEFASMPGEPDDDDMEHTHASPLVSLGNVRDDFGNEDPKGDGVGAGLGLVVMESSGITTDPDPSSRARDLISRDLLNELSHESHSGTPPLKGFETPSDPGTPSPRGVQQSSYQTNHNHEGLMSLDQWDWKTDAPEFVPGSMKGLMDNSVNPYTQHTQATWTMQPNQAMSSVGSNAVLNSGATESARVSEIRSEYEWQLRTRADELRELQQRMQQLEIETAQTRASWEVERRGLTRQISHYRAVLERYCIPVDEAGTGYNMEDPQNHYFPVFEPSAPSQWNTGNASGNAHGANSSSFDPAARGQAFGGGSFQPAQANNEGSYGQQGHFGTGSASAEVAGNAGNTSLDSKMKQLSSLLQEGNTSAGRNGSGSFDSDNLDPDGAGSGYSGGYIASTLRAMFPHATIRTKAAAGEDGDDDDIAEEDFEAVENRGLGGRRPARLVENSTVNIDKQKMGREASVISQMIQTLESATGSKVDDRAMTSFQSLSEKQQLQCLQKTGELVDQQGGSCRNLSSILQSVCRKYEKRSNKNAENARDTRSTRRARREDDDEHDAFDSSVSDGDRDFRDGKASGHGKSWPQEFERAALRATAKAAREADRERNNSSKDPLKELAPPEGAGTPISRRSAAGSKSWADIEDGDDDDNGKGRFEEEHDAWTPALVEKLARKGFELKRCRGNQWELKIIMSQLEPPLTELGMERYCHWLRARLSQFRDEQGQDALWHCRGELDFSHNRMSNQMVWSLLETLAQHEVHTAVIKLYANQISQGGVLAICEFIRMNERADAVQELHLSHNEIDDESALELLRVLKAQRPKYPPRRIAEGSGELVLAPVWLRLNHNKIQDPAAVLRMAEEEGVTVCTAWDRQVCGTSKCVRHECALVHLYSFTVQNTVAQREEDGGDREGGGRRRERRRFDRS